MPTPPYPTMGIPQKLILRNATLADGRLVNVTWIQSHGHGKKSAACRVSIEDASLTSTQTASAASSSARGDSETAAAGPSVIRPFQSPSVRCRPSSTGQSKASEQDEGEELVEIDAAGQLLLPSGLAHPHVHLDKCYLLDRCAIGDG